MSAPPRIFSSSPPRFISPHSLHTNSIPFSSLNFGNSPSLNRLPRPSSNSAATATSGPIPSSTMEPLTLPKYPKYLEGSPYAELVQKQYELRRACYSSDKRREEQVESAPSSVYTAIRKAKIKSSSQSFLLSVDNADKLEDLDLRLPTAWNPNDKGHCVELTSDNRRLKYVGMYHFICKFTCLYHPFMILPCIHYAVFVTICGFWFQWPHLVTLPHF
jgi:hypothetical protein